MICAQNSIYIDDDCLISWGTQIIDSDLHAVEINGLRVNEDGTVTIENHVWICSNVIILKHTIIRHDCVVGAMTLLNTSYTECNALIT